MREIRCKAKEAFLKIETLPGYLCCNYYVLNIQTNLILIPFFMKQKNALLELKTKSKNIICISIAAFRYTSKLKNIILTRFPDTKLFLGEFILCPDGKYRYIRPIRVIVYRKIIDWIKNYGKYIPIYFCMESPAVWNDVFGKISKGIDNLKKIF